MKDNISESNYIVIPTLSLFTIIVKKLGIIEQIPVGLAFPAESHIPGRLVRPKNILPSV